MTRLPPGPGRSGERRRVALGLAVVLLLAALPGLSAAPPVRPAVATVLAVTQSPGPLTEQGAVTVSLEVASTANIHQVYFTFCQLTTSVCYFPVVMNPTAGGWYVGTTSPMSAYPGMGPGISAGYNITILYNDNSTSSEPSVPNAFANLTVAATVTGEYVFKVTVANLTYGVDGRVVDSATGHTLAGATVTMSPGTALTTVTNASGGYAFTNLSNGSYTLSVTLHGYDNATLAVVVSGQSVVQDVSLNATSVTQSHSTPGPGSASGALGFLESPTGLGVVGAIVVVVAAALALILLQSRRRRGRDGERDPGSSATPPTGP